MSIETAVEKSNEPSPPIYIHLEDEQGNCACNNDKNGGIRKADFETKIEDNKLHINLFEYGAMPIIGPADEISAVRVHVRGKNVTVFAIYKDPQQTATMGCCTGS
ncbi:TPA: hypothetical protein ACWXBI_005472, partial [Klebsiella pneumoniae]